MAFHTSIGEEAAPRTTLSPPPSPNAASSAAAAASAHAQPTPPNQQQLQIELPPMDDHFLQEVGFYCFEHADHVPCAAGCDAVFVGSVRHATDPFLLSRFGITHVLNCAAGDCTVPTKEYARRGIAYCEVEGKDEENYPLLRKHLTRCLNFLHPCLMAGGSGKALVHCVAGRNRSATIAIAAVMYSLRIPLQVVLRRLFQRRPFILTNLSFRHQLKELAAAQGLLFAPQGLVRAANDWAGVGHAARFATCERCGQRHVCLHEARVDFSLRADCSKCTVGEVHAALMGYLGTPQFRIEIDASQGVQPTPPGSAVASGRVATVSEAAGPPMPRAKPNSLLVPPTLDLPVQPLAQLKLAELPRPIHGGARGPGEPAAILHVYDQVRKVVLTVGIHDTRGADGIDFRPLP